MTGSAACPSTADNRCKLASPRRKLDERFSQGGHPAHHANASYLTAPQHVDRQLTKASIQDAICSYLPARSSMTIANHLLREAVHINPPVPVVPISIVAHYRSHRSLYDILYGDENRDRYLLRHNNSAADDPCTVCYIAWRFCHGVIPIPKID